nr:MAG TPA: hypothetical protein [Caudoviricetes sp.]
MWITPWISNLPEDHFRYFRVRGCVQIDVSQTGSMSVRRADIFNHVGRVRIMPEQHQKAPSGRKHLGKVTAVSGVGHPVSVVHVFLLQSRCPGFSLISACHCSAASSIPKYYGFVCIFCGLCKSLSPHIPALIHNML